MSGQPELPETLKGLRAGNDLAFTYAYKNGSTRRIVGRLDTLLVNEAGDVTALRVRVNLTRTESCPLTDRLSREAPRNPLARFEASRVTVEAAARDIRAPRRAEPTAKQVEYALSLAGRWDDQGDSLFPGMTRERFQAMSRREVSDWIGTARSEMGLEEDL